MSFSSTDRLEELREILFEKDRKLTESLIDRINELDGDIESGQRIISKVEPLVENKIQDFQDRIPTQLSGIVTDALKKELKNSQDRVIELLYPIIGKLIKKYIANEIQVLKDKINHQFKNRFSFNRVLLYFKSWFFKVDKEELILGNLAEKSEIVEILITDSLSGILLGNYTKLKTIDKDMLSGMLTAIKSFSEDALSTPNQELEYIEYESYHICLKNFLKYYVVVILHHGEIDAKTKIKVDSLSMDIANKVMSPIIRKNKKIENNQELISKNLNKLMDGWNK